MIRSYKSTFILVFSVLVIVTVISVGYNAYRRATQVSLGLSTDIINEMSEKISNRTTRIFAAAYVYLETDALLFSGKGPAVGRDQAFHIFWRQLQLEPQLLSIYAADPAGNFLQVREQPQLVTRHIERQGARTDEKLIYRDRQYRPIAHINGGGLYDPRGTRWYAKAVEARGELYWSSVYRLSSTGQLGFTAAKAVYDGGETLKAVVGVDITLDSLSEFLAEQKGARDAVALIVDREDNLVAFPFDLMLKKHPSGKPPEALVKVNDLAETWVVDAYHRLRAGRHGIDEGAPALLQGFQRGTQDTAGYAVIESGSTRYIAHTHAFPTSWSDGWQLVVVVPEASLLSDASRLLSESVVISVIILISAVVLVSLLALHLFAPMRELVKNTELVKQLRFEEVKPVSSRFYEIEAMDQAICGMRQGLQTLAKFVPAVVARDLIQSGREVKPGGEVVELTLFISAMSEFGSLCRTLSPERITTILSAILDQFTRIVERNRGSIGSYLGESILAFWGAPLALDDGPERACRAALQCLRSGEALRRRSPQDFPPQASTHFAIHAGKAIVGNVGSADRMSYTAIGDNVELAWQLKQLNRRYGTRIIVSDPVKSAIGDRFWLRRLDVIALREAGETLAIHELLGERPAPLSEETQDLVRRYEQGLDALGRRDWDGAQSHFEALLRDYPEDKSVRLMAERSNTRAGFPSDGERGRDGTASGALPEKI